LPRPSKKPGSITDPWLRKLKSARCDAGAVHEVCAEPEMVAHIRRRAVGCLPVPTAAHPPPPRLCRTRCDDDCIRACSWLDIGASIVRRIPPVGWLNATASAWETICRLQDVCSRSRAGYINFYSVYIAWLCSAVFLHLPSMGKLGLDIKADISILLTTFLVFPFAFSFREAINRCNP